MNEKHIEIIATELHLRGLQVEFAGQLLDEGATVPFIARYRKEATDGLDEVNIIAIRDWLEQLSELDKRRQSVIAILGPRDYFDIFPAPHSETAFKVATIIWIFGHAQTEVWMASECQKFKDMVRNLPGETCVWSSAVLPEKEGKRRSQVNHAGPSTREHPDKVCPKNGRQVHPLLSGTFEDLPISEIGLRESLGSQH